MSINQDKRSDPQRRRCRVKLLPHVEVVRTPTRLRQRQRSVLVYVGRRGSTKNGTLVVFGCHRHHGLSHVRRGDRWLELTVYPRALFGWQPGPRKQHSFRLLPCLHLGRVPSPFCTGYVGPGSFCLLAGIHHMPVLDCQRSGWFKRCWQRRLYEWWLDRQGVEW